MLARRVEVEQLLPGHVRRHALLFPAIQAVVPELPLVQRRARYSRVRVAQLPGTRRHLFRRNYPVDAICYIAADWTGNLSIRHLWYLARIPGLRGTIMRTSRQVICRGCNQTRLRRFRLHADYYYPRYAVLGKSSTAVNWRMVCRGARRKTISQGWTG